MVEHVARKGNNEGLVYLDSEVTTSTQKFIVTESNLISYDILAHAVIVCHHVIG